MAVLLFVCFFVMEYNLKPSLSVRKHPLLAVWSSDGLVLQTDWKPVWDDSGSSVVCLRMSSQTGFCIPLSFAKHDTHAAATTYCFIAFLCLWTCQCEVRRFVFLLTAVSASAHPVWHQLSPCAALKTDYLMNVVCSCEQSIAASMLWYSCVFMSSTLEVPFPAQYLIESLHLSSVTQHFTLYLQADFRKQEMKKVQKSIWRCKEGEKVKESPVTEAFSPVILCDRGETLTCCHCSLTRGNRAVFRRVFFTHMFHFTVMTRFSVGKESNIYITYETPEWPKMTHYEMI